MSLARMRVVHRTGFRYDEPVSASYNEARMTPTTTQRQSVLAARVAVEPVTWTFGYRDYWDTQVTAFDVLVPHEELAVVSSSTVEIHDGPDPVDGAGWDVLAAPAVLDARHEYLAHTASSLPHEEVVGLARDAAGDLGPDDAARAVCEMLRSKLEYVPGSTAVTSTAAEVWEHRKGVCQDFAHVTIGALRSLGIPTRYVSGYLHPKSGAAVGETVEGQSHAWIEWWAGDWMPFDPTGVSPVGQDHVIVARGRDYTDVTPLKGIYTGATGSPDSTLFVSVAVTRLM